jgi:hypothetical protein
MHRVALRSFAGRSARFSCLGALRSKKDTRVRERSDVSAILLSIMLRRAYAARFMPTKTQFIATLKLMSLLADYRTGAPMTP